MGGRAGRQASERAHGERLLRLEMSPISKHPNFKNLWQPQLFNSEYFSQSTTSGSWKILFLAQIFYTAS
jgi:hypothetical protein